MIYCSCPSEHTLNVLYRRALKALMENHNERARDIAADALYCIEKCTDEEKRKRAQFREAFIAIRDAAQIWL